MTRSEIEEKVIELYVGLLGRAPDFPGLTYWADEIEAGRSTLEDTRAAFASEDQPEYWNIYGNLDSTTLVNTIYHNFLERSPDQEGLAYWVAELDSDRVNPDQMVNAIINAIQAPGVTDPQTLVDAQVLANKVDAATYFAYQNQDETNITGGFLSQAKAVVGSVNQDPATLAAARAFVDQLGDFDWTVEEDTLTLAGEGSNDLAVDLAAMEITAFSQTLTIDPATNSSGAAIELLNVDASALGGTTGVSVAGSDVDNRLIGSNKADNLSGGVGADTLIGGEGADTLAGGLGNDIFLYENSAGASIGETIDGGEGTDTIQVDASSLDLSGVAATNVESIVLGGSASRLTVNAQQYDSVTSIDGSAAEGATLSFSDLQTFVLAGDAVVMGIANVTIDNGNSADLTGDDADNILTTGANVDQLEGRAGADQLDGGAGGDFYVYSDAAHSRLADGVDLTSDTILNFDFDSADRLVVPAEVAWVNTYTLTAGFFTNLASSLDADAGLQALFATAGVGAVLVTVSSGTAAADYLLIEDGTDDTSFNSSEDMAIRLVGATNKASFDVADFMI